MGNAAHDGAATRDGKIGFAAAVRGSADGVGGAMDPRDSSTAFGNETIDTAVDIAVKETLHRLENRSKYQRHRQSVSEGLWKQS